MQRHTGAFEPFSKLAKVPVEPGFVVIADFDVNHRVSDHLGRSLRLFGLNSVLNKNNVEHGIARRLR